MIIALKVGFLTKDHLFCFLKSLSVSQLVRRLKQESTRQLWLSHHNTLRQYYWYRKILWSDGFFVCSIGEASPETIRQYILSQG
jgi:putative transposase